MNRFAFGTAMSYLHTSSYKIETFKNQDNETSITASSPMQKNGSKRLLPRIGFVSIPYYPSFILRCSFFLRSIVLASRSGNNTERYVSIAGLIRGRQEEQGRIMGEAMGYPTKNITMT